jgi:hypothetical protein
MGAFRNDLENDWKIDADDGNLVPSTVICFDFSTLTNHESKK